MFLCKHNDYWYLVFFFLNLTFEYLLFLLAVVTSFLALSETSYDGCSCQHRHSSFCIPDFCYPSLKIQKSYAEQTFQLGRDLCIREINDSLRTWLTNAYHHITSPSQYIHYSHPSAGQIWLPIPFAQVTSFRKDTTPPPFVSPLQYLFIITLSTVIASACWVLDMMWIICR